MRKLIISFIFILLSSITVDAQTHWSCNQYSFQYDMTVYVSLQLDGIPATGSNYEVAAFCGDECRGVGELSLINGSASYYYLRIRSNVASGEKIVFKYFNKSTSLESLSRTSLSFVSDKLTGYPSSPYPIANIIMGDVSGDGVISTFDAVMTVQRILGAYNDTFIEKAADMSLDNVISTYDVVLITNKILKK